MKLNHLSAHLLGVVLISSTSSVAQTPSPTETHAIHLHHVSHRGFRSVNSELRVSAEANAPFTANVHQSLTLRREDETVYTIERLAIIARDDNGKIYEASDFNEATRTYLNLVIIDHAERTMTMCSVSNWHCFIRKVDASSVERSKAKSAQAIEPDTSVEVETKILFETRAVHHVSSDLSKNVKLSGIGRWNTKDYWVFPELGFYSSMNRSLKSGTEATETKITNLKVGNADLTMFTIPSDVRVIKLEVPNQ